MAIQVGDAVLRFMGDTADLEMAFTKVRVGCEETMTQVAAQSEGAAVAVEGIGAAATETASEMQVAFARMAQATVNNRVAQAQLYAALKAAGRAGADDAQAVAALARAQMRAAAASQELTAAQKQVAAATQQATLAQKEAGESAILMGQEMTAAGEQAAFSMREAKASMALVGEEVGVKIPRHLRGFVASLPGVGAALEAAFSGIAIVILIQLIAEAANKLTDFVSETFIYTDAMKEAYQAELDLNKAIKERADRLKDLQKQMELMGLSGWRRTAKEIEQLNRLWEENEAKIRNASNTLWQYKQEQADNDFSVRTITKAQADKARKDYQAAIDARKEFQKQFESLTKQGNQELLDEQIQAGEAQIAADKMIGQARLDLALAQGRVRYAQLASSLGEQIQSQKDYEEQKYQLELRSLERQRAVLAQDPTKNANQLRAINAQILAVEMQHTTALLNNYAELVEKIKAIRRQAIEPQGSSVQGLIPLSAEGKALEQLQELFRQFGVQSSATWTEQVVGTEAAIEAAKKLGASYTDLLQLQEKLLTAKLGQAIAFGDAAGADEAKRQLEEIREQMDRLGLSSDRLARGLNSFPRLIDAWMARMVKSRGELKKWEQGVDAAIGSLTGAFGSAIQQWILGQESLGQALRMALAQELAAMAGRAAAWGAYWLAWAVVDTFWNPARAGAEYATAAQLFALAAAYGGAAAAINPGRKAQGEAGAGSPIETTGSQEQPQAQPVQTTNIHRFAAGALISRPTLAIVGDAMSGASARGAAEAVIPLTDSSALQSIADALGPYLRGSGVIYETNFNGAVITPDTIQKFARAANKAVKKNGVRLVASDSLRVTRKG